MTGNDSRVVTPPWSLLSFHRLSEAITFARHLEDVAAMRQAVQKCRRHPFALEDLAPVGEAKVGRDQQAPAFVAIGEDLKEKFRADSTERDIA